MKRAFIIIGLVLTLLLAGGFLYLRYGVLAVKDTTPKGKYAQAGIGNAGKPIAKSDVDLRPALVAKLQELVKDGSEGLYLLSIDSLEPDVLGSKVRARGLKLRVDTQAYSRLDRIHRLPDDVFKITMDALEIDGLGIADLLHKRTIDLESIYINGPTIEVYHRKRTYNAAKREKAKEKTLYEKLSKGMDRIAINKVGIHRSRFIRHNISSKDEVTEFKDVDIMVDDILIDSSTQYDQHRFLFAKNARLESNDYNVVTPDGLYLFRIGTLTVNANAHTVTARNMSLMPNGGRAAFEKRTKTKEEMFELNTPSLVVSDIDWWALMNGEQFFAGKAEISGGSLLVYLNKTKPESPGTVDNFPQQLLKRIKSPVNLQRALFHRFDITYQELNPKSGKMGAVSFNNMEVDLNHITNMPSEIAKNNRSKVKGRGKMMNKVDINIIFDFDLRKSSRGGFVVDVAMGAMSNAVVNSFSERLGMVTIKSGQAQKATAHVTGNNAGAKAKVAMAYTDLHIRPLKKDKDEEGGLKKKKVTSVIANLIFVKDNNPGKNGELREPEVEVGRLPNSNFFSLVWSAIEKGMLESVGIPPKLGMKNK